MSKRRLVASSMRRLSRSNVQICLRVQAINAVPPLVILMPDLRLVATLDDPGRER